MKTNEACKRTKEEAKEQMKLTGETTQCTRKKRLPLIGRKANRKRKEELNALQSIIMPAKSRTKTWPKFLIPKFLTQSKVKGASIVLKVLQLLGPIFTYIT